MNPDYLHGFLGGCLIGGGSLLALIVTGKIPGISGVFGRLLKPKQNETSWRLVFLLGLIAGAGLLFQLSEQASIFRVPDGRNWLVYAIAGIVVGFGTRLGGGCTSGHGVCGMGMGARDSMVATVVFMAAGMFTVTIFRLLTS
ncbi:MAG: YeeE/YedE thiosulfate transporter family protein [Verrucomicrobiales bacterium]|nr:YeeE/YedE thiosulfate transporter family protein [Verrucomicrobiales bacterium]